MGYRKNIKIFLNYFLGPIIFCCLCWVLYSKLAGQQDLALRWMQIKASFQNPLLWLAIFLVPINWGLESLKWQWLTKRLENFSFLTAFKSVLAGCSVTMLTPNRVGEYGGRIIYVKEENRIAAIPITVLGSMSQLFVTAMMGTVGLIFLHLFSEEGKRMDDVVPSAAFLSLLILGAALSCFLLLLYLRIGWITHWLLRFKRMKNYVKYIHFLEDYSRKELLRILVFSALRYMVFILQYMLILEAMEVTIAPIPCFWLLTVFYLMITLAPTIGITELPVRATASTMLLQMYSSNVLGIQAASLSIWCINLVLPAIIGSLLIFGIKIIKEK